MPWSAVGDGLIRVIRDQFALDWDGCHGFPHWERVRENGLCLAELTGADARIIELFAVFHDAKRVSEGTDVRHGERGAEFVKALSGSFVRLSPEDLALLETACRRHNLGLIVSDVTVQTCWDADRLDLGRVGMRPDPRLLGTDAARDPEMIRRAYARSLK